MPLHPISFLRHCLNPRIRADDGFTLLEMLVAVTILSGSMVMIMGTLSWSLNQSQQSERAMEARVLAETLLAETNAPGIELTRESQGETETGLSWHVQIRPYRQTDNEEPIRAAIVVADVHWSQHGSQKTYSLSNLLLLPKDALP